MSLHTLQPAQGARKNRKRVGRGESSGWGKTSGRGSKGQKARSGVSMPGWFEGGQMPLTRRVPKRGFSNVNRVTYTTINLDCLQKLDFDKKTSITPEILIEKGLIKERNARIKILARGTVDKALSVKAHAFSRAAAEKIVAAGGQIEVID
ncbi:50S ribosomal protein L15 [bacterium]|nr:50S ribosomal protein L15 [bacterium]